MYGQQESEYYRARLRAARKICRGWVRGADLPTDAEIREEIHALAGLYESREPRDELCQLRWEKLGHSRATASDAQATGAVGQRPVDRFRLFETMLRPLEFVTESPETHPEGDVLYHSLQVFDLACDELPYDEEFLLAALLHDVGKAIDQRDHLAAGLRALDGLITERTAWLIEFHVVGRGIRDGSIGRRARKRLQANESFEDLQQLVECDLAGRVRGVPASSVEEALDYVRNLADHCEG